MNGNGQGRVCYPMLSFTRMSSAGIPSTPASASPRPAHRQHARPRLRNPANYRCSLGTNTVLGLVTNGLLAVLADGGAEN
jgi:hypothetical protein